jgi:PST family polysaccharide transporter
MAFMAQARSDQFRTDHLLSDLRGRAARGGATTLAGQGVKFALQVSSTAILARVLTPGDFGLVAMVTAVTGFVMLFKDLGFSMATVQRHNITHEQVSTLFWVNVVTSGAIMAFTAVISPVIGWFYDEARLIGITVALSCGILLGGLAVQHQALLNRQMRFRAIVTIDITAQLAGILAAVTAAWHGLGFWSLVLMQLVTASANTIGVWVACGWRPGRPVRKAGVREMLTFGGNMTSFGVINYFARTLDNMLIGWYWGAGPLGFYSRAYALLLFPIGQIVAPINSVANPTLSRLQGEPDRFRLYYLKALNVIAYITMPLVVILGVLSRDIILILMGEQWLEAGEIFRILAFAAFWQPATSTVGCLYVSLNRTRRFAFWGLISSPIVMLSFCIGLPWGAKGVALAYSVCMWIMVYPAFWFALKNTPVSIVSVFNTLSRPVLLSFIIGVYLQTVRIAIDGLNVFWVIAISCVCVVIGVFLLSRVWKGFRDDIALITQLGKSAIFNAT